MKKNKIKETASYLYLNTFSCVVCLIGVSKCERLEYILFNLVLATTMAIFAANSYAKLQVLKNNEK